MSAGASQICRTTATAEAIAITMMVSANSFAMLPRFPPPLRLRYTGKETALEPTANLLPERLFLAQRNRAFGSSGKIRHRSILASCSNILGSGYGVRCIAAQRPDRAGLVSFNIKHRGQSCCLKHVFYLVAEVCELKFAALMANRRMNPNQVA